MSKKDHTMLTQTEISFNRFEELSFNRSDKVLKGEDTLIPVLRVIEGANKGEHYILSKDQSIIGRDRKCTFYFKDPKMSRKHAQFTVEKRSNERKENIVKIVDLESRNGVWVNEVKIATPVEILNGDTVKIGGLLFGFYLKFVEEIDLENYLFKLATKDITTGLLTKSFFESSLEFEFRRCQRYKRPMTFVIMDLDHFKKVNDTYGHPIGDLVLKEVGGILTKQLRFEDTAIRYGGEEFAIILPETNSLDAIAVLERIRNNIQEHHFRNADNEKFHVTASFGLAEFSNDFPDTKSLVDSADKSLYQAKNTGRNKICQIKKLAKIA